MTRPFSGFMELVDSLEFTPFGSMRRGDEPDILIEHLEQVRERLGESHASEVYEEHMRRWKAWHAARPLKAGMVLRLEGGEYLLVGHCNELSGMLGDGCLDDSIEERVEAVAFLY